MVRSGADATDEVIGRLEAAAHSASWPGPVPRATPGGEVASPPVTDVDAASADAPAGAHVLDVDGRRPWGPWRPVFIAMIGLAVLVGVVLRFVARSPLWLDEALSVNIARLPYGEIGQALRQDGHPPLFYWLLHGWMEVFGTGTVAVRAFSGMWSLALFPLVWIAARRLGGQRVAWFATVLLALSPYAIRYGTETRMYAMVSVLALAGWLLVDDARRQPTLGRLAGIAAVSSALLWTHYWSLWLLGAAGMLLLSSLWLARRRHEDIGATVRILGAMAVGVVTFLPWLPTLLYQGSRTGTPWARPLRPTEIVTFTVADFGGGPLAEQIVLGWFLALLAITGLFGTGIDARTVAIDLRTRAEARPLAALILLIVVIATVAGYASGATYASRYAAVFFPFVILLGALGLERFRSRPVALGILAVVMVFGGFGGGRNALIDRSDARRSADAIEKAGAPGDVVAYCPDQLGPATSRLLDPAFDQGTYPEFAPPQRVDWVDYDERLAAASPDAFAEDLIERAEGQTIFLVYSTTYVTHTDICPALFNAIANRGLVAETLSQPSEAFESASVVAFRTP